MQEVVEVSEDSILAYRHHVEIEISSKTKKCQSHTRG